MKKNDTWAIIGLLLMFLKSNLFLIEGTSFYFYSNIFGASFFIIYLFINKRTKSYSGSNRAFSRCHSGSSPSTHKTTKSIFSVTSSYTPSQLLLYISIRHLAIFFNACGLNFIRKTLPLPYRCGTISHTHPFSPAVLHGFPAPQCLRHQ